MLILLLYGGGEVWAQDPRVKGDDIIIQVMPSGKEEKESVTTSEGTVSAIVAALTGENYQVTLTVTPASGYKIKKDLIVVEKMVNPDRSSRRRTPGIGTFVLDGSTDWVTIATDYTFTIPAEYDGAYVTATFVSTAATPKVIVSLDEIDDFTAAGNYKLGRDIVASGSSLGEFSGTLDGDSHIIYNLSNPLFSSINGGTVKNLFFDNVSIRGGTNAGAVCGEATGDSRIFNCGVLATGSIVETDAKGYTSITSSSSSVSGTGSVGGLVGVLDGTSRVINCFSYANITGGNLVGGIVGENKYATNSDLEHLKTMVMNCMFYGDITGGTNKAPIYNGTNIVNKDAKGVGNYNYFRSEASWAKGTINTPNCALMAEDRFLQRFEFFRHLLNSHLELAGWWATGTYDKSEMMKWVLEPSQIGTSTPYPILKTPGKYASVVNIDVNHSTDIPTVGTTMGTLGVSISKGTGGAVYGAPTGASIINGSLTLNITDKDPEHFNFNYGKVQLPYYNDVGTKNYTGNRVVTGWKITSITDGTPGTFKKEDSAAGYNFADRKCTNKDLYSVSGRVFNQGAYWDVPEGVTAITIEPYWAKCTYLADPNADKVYNTAMNAGYDVPNVGGGQIYTNGNSYSIAGESQVVFTTMGNAIASSDNGLFDGVTGTPGNQTVYDYAVVLVGNYHFHSTKDSNLDANASKPYTVTSIDLDGDNEPDYSYILRFDSRTPIHPARVDFINIPGLGMAQKSTGGTGTYNFGILQPKGFFESTNTSLFRVTQFEYDAGRAASPTIVQGGVFEQWVGGQQTAHKNQITYFHVGGNVWFKEFHRGTHQDQKHQTKHPPVSVTGGDYDEFYLTGLYRGDVNSYADNAECYINGGRFGTVCGAAMEGIGKANGADNTGNITWKIQNADIKEFYAGGLNAAKPVTGNLSTDIVDSRVDIFCGGPKFGDMSANKTVTTNATNCTFGTFFGAGYGGNSYSRQAPFNHNNIINFPHNDKDAGNDASWNAWLARFYMQEYNAEYGGVSTQFNYQFLPMSSNTENVARIFVEYVKFSLATTRNVTSTLTGCTITGNFYGGGSLGKVDGNVTSTLTGCTVNGDAFGAGFSGSLPTVEVDDPTGFETEPSYYTNFGTYRTGVKKPTTTYNWKHGDAISIDKDKKILYTNEDLTALGTVTGKAILNIESLTTVRGNVYGGGESSDVAEKTKTGEDIAAVQVNIKGGTINHDVFGGGKGKTTVVNGKVEVNIGAKDSGTGELSGSGNVSGNVYGGSAFGAVNATKGATYESDPTDIDVTTGKETKVNLYGGTVTGNVFGGGLGQTSPSSIAAQNFGNTTVNMEGGTVRTAVYGGANVNGVMKADATVTILGGTVGTDPGVGGSIKNVVFGGGFGQPTLVNGNVKVNVGTKSGEPAVYAGNAIIWGNVYGGGAFGNVNTSKPANVLVFDATKKTEVYLYAGTINGNVYGGGLGKKEVVAKDAVGSPGDPGYEPAVEHEDGIEAFVGGDVFVLLDGAKLKYDDSETPLTGQIFGCNNLNGTPKGHVKVHVKRTIDSTKDTEVARDSRTTYDVTAVYGGGNQADYIPTDALLDPAVEGNPAKIEKATAEVIIDGCDDTSIEYVYGGGNAAAVPASEVTILGSYIIHYVFGGGNGKSTSTFTNPGANIGLYNNGTSYGSGKAVTKLVGCHAHYVFGGSNTKGNVREGTSILMPDKSLYPAPEYDCCNVRDIGEIYGAGNEAEQDGSVTLILGCVHNMKNVYGGARMANVKGGIDLVVTSGTFEGVFGGNDMSGTIQGPITVTIEETGCDPLEIDNLYLGGNQAAYSIYGYKNTGTVDAPVLVARTKAEYDALVAQIDGKTEEEIAASNELKAIAEQLSGLPYSHPVLNVVSCTRIGKTSGEDLGGAFGGGLGTGAVMYGNPTVNINMIPGKFGADTNSDGNPDALGTITNVYGGGKEANVEGNTAVNIGTEEKIAHRTSMGVEIPVGDRVQKDVQPAIITSNVFGAGKGLKSDVNSALVTGNTTIVIEKATIAKSVYGGGELSQVGGNTDITVRGGAIGDPTGANGGEVYGNVYGGGKGNTTNVRSGLVKGNTNITIENTVADAEYAAAHSVAEGSVITSPSIYHNIYGGGAHGSVGTYTYASDAVDAAIDTYTSGGTANITITGGTIGVNGHENGMVFGSSRGDVGAPNSIYDKVAWVYNTNVEIGTSGQGAVTKTPLIKGSVYGGGENGHVYENASVTIHSGMVGITDALAVDPEGQKGAKYPFRGNVYGAGCGMDKYVDTGDDNKEKYNPLSGIVNGNTTVDIKGGCVVRDVYGAGAMGSVEGSTTVTIEGNAEIGVDAISGGGNVFAAARGDASEPTMATVSSSNLNINGGTIWMDAFGGGQNGAVKGSVAVSIAGGIVNRDVYGGGALAKTNTSEYVLVRGLTVGESSVAGYYTRMGDSEPYTYTAVTGDSPKAADGTDYYQKSVTTVNLSGGTITHDLYGGGLGEYTDDGDDSNDVAANVNGPVTVTVSNGEAARVFGCNNVYGSPKQTVVVNITGTTAMPVGSAIGDVFGGGNQAAYSGSTSTPITVSVSGGTVNNVYGGGLGTTAVVNGSTSVTISKTATTSPTIANNVFGGGSEADVTRNVSVSITGGTVINDVYGGGALANTNTDNWDTSANAGAGGWKVTNSTPIVHYEEVKHLKAGDDVSTFYTSSTGAGGLASGTYVENTTYYKQLTHPTDIYNIADGHTEYRTTVLLTGGIIGNAYGGGLGQLGTGVHYTAEECQTHNAGISGALTAGVALTAEQATAYNATLTGAIAAGAKLTTRQKNDVNAAISTSYNAGDAISAADAAAYNATLTGHKVADDTLTSEEAIAYNATLPGAWATSDWATNPAEGAGNRKAMVYGDVDVTVDGTAFTDDVEFINAVENVAKHGRVFGCNNLNGTPKGKVTVTVNATKRVDGSNGHVRGELELQAVYGGGNLANYVPETYDKTDDDVHTGQTEFGQKTRVIINGCSNVSINKVYGGGNAATVPFTDVTIEGAYEIGYVFGGGNGGDKVNYGEGWQRNPGADVTHYANVMLKGGTIGQAFGGSDTRGTVGGTDVKQSTSADCPLRIVNLYGAGNGDEALTDGDINITVSACGEGSEIQNVFGGSYKANIKGSVTMTITSGIFASVYGGNDRMGSVGGDITINIEETGDCNKPIIIQNLYGGCYQTAYPGVGAKDEYGDDFLSGNITVNVKSATRIDRIFGGSENGAVTGNTTVNINMVEGSQNGHSGVALPSYYGVEGASIPSNIHVTGTEGWVEVHGLITDDSNPDWSSVVGYYYTPYTSATGTAVDGTTYYEKYDAYYAVPSGKITVGTTVVTSYFTKDGAGNYSAATGDANGKAEANYTYYQRVDAYRSVSVSVGDDVTSYYIQGAYTAATGQAQVGITYYKKAVVGRIDPGIGTIGEVYGGGNMGNVTGNAIVNIVTEPTVTMESETDNPATAGVDEREHTVLGAHIDGNVYGGGRLADVLGNTAVNICAKKNGSDVYEAVAEGAQHVTIGGNVFGGGKGSDANFECDKAMVGTNNEGISSDHGNTKVTIGNGTISGSVYGGGEIGRVENNSEVTIGLTSGASSSPEVTRYVYGAGKGVETHGYSALVRGEIHVTIDANAKVGESVYGGGELASVGRYKVKLGTNNPVGAPDDLPVGMAYELKDPVGDPHSGKCIVTIQGNAEIGPNDMTMPTFSGNVFGAGKGILPTVYTYTGEDKPKRMQNGDIWDALDSESEYLTFIETLAMSAASEVVIGGNAFIKGSVYGGSENGHVLNNTRVTIQDHCQIGAGYDESTSKSLDKYEESAFIDPIGKTASVINAAALKECNHWPYGQAALDADKYAPYDKFAGTTGYDSKGGSTTGDDGHTYYGNVFGGGSGKEPYAPGKWLRSAGLVGGNTVVNITGGHILTCVYGGNEMTDVGTKDLTAVPGKGKCTVNMVGGTLGVPRTLEQIKAHPVTCYLFGAGKGDQRTPFNTWTNVRKAEVYVSGTALIYGSTFGGGEDGHVLENAFTNIGGSVDFNGDGDTTDEGETIIDPSPTIGTWGTSYVDGNVFGGGRGFSGDALTAGTVGGNVTVNIENGTMLGSVYGGGRLASVGIHFTSTTDPLYGELKEDETSGVNPKTFGHITVNISGGTIGNDLEFQPVPRDVDKTELNKWKADNSIPNTEFAYGKDDNDADLYLLTHTKGGNVFGGNMGRLTLLDGSMNPVWPKLAQAKTAAVNITGGIIKGNVYGGGEFGTIREDAHVTIGGTWDASTNAISPSGTPTIVRDVYGGGYGSEDHSPEMTATITSSVYGGTYTFIPMQFAGSVGGDTYVNICGGKVQKSVYGGGELATVGIIDYKAATKHGSDDSSPNDFGLSWPYDFTFMSYTSGGEGPVGGTTHVKITGGRIGITGKDYTGPDKIEGVAITADEIKARRTDNGDVYGGGKGKVGPRYDYAFCANVKEAIVNVEYPVANDADPGNYTENDGDNDHDCIAGSVYGGGENGHVMNNASVTLTNGLIGHAIYGGGKGKDTYKKNLNKVVGSGTYKADVYSITAGKVYGNTSVTMEGGYVVRNIYGGGNMASVGKGNYAGGADDYYPSGYGETLTGNLWDNDSDNSKAFLGSGKSAVTITGGTVGTASGEKDGLPYGNVYGGCRGQAAAEVMGINTNPDIFLGYVNETEVIIGDGSGGPLIYGSVYGGGQDGHVRRETSVTINNGEIGLEHNAANITAVGLKDKNDNDVDLDHFKWKHRGNVYGGGSGIGQYSFDYNGDGIYSVNEKGYSSSAGHVTHTTSVTIKGGTIHRNVYGGGSLASVCPPSFDASNPPNDDDSDGKGKMSVTTVNVSGGNIGCATDEAAGYGGNVFGACRGESAEGINNSYFAICTHTKTNILPNTADRTKDTQIFGNVYGGGEIGSVALNTNVNLKGGEIKHSAYGGGKGIKADANGGGVTADVGGSTTVLLNEGVADDAKGCIVNKIFGCNDQNGSPKGHVLVHVYATQHKDKANISQKVAPPEYSTVKGSSEAYAVYLKRVIDVAKSGEGGTLLDGITASVITDAESVWITYKDKDDAALTADEKAEITNAAKSVVNEIESLHDYDVKAVYGGGDLAAYMPYGPAADGTDADYKATTENTEVIIEGCDVTSIEQVYGGGNAAPVPATDVKVNSVFIIDQLYGGGNGLDNYQIGDTYYENPGANVGYKNFTTVYKSTDTGYTNVATNGSGTVGDPYKAITNADATDKDGRANYAYGGGQATTLVTGGHIHKVYGGSNHKGNIRYEVLSQYQHSGTCLLVTDETYGGSKDAETDGEIHVVLDCVEYGGTYFGGSQNANINNNVTIDITNGTFDRIFGGNNTAGTINGAITINIEEKGCTPIIIGELYGGGYMAPYSIYGYNESDTYEAKDENGNDLWVDDSDHSKGKVQQRKPYYPGDVDALDTPHRDPYINIISATSIGSIYGGGYKAKVIGSPHINVNMQKGMILKTYAQDMAGYSSLTVENGGIDASGNMLLPIGTIGNIFGGGNMADIIGNTSVEIGTGKHHNHISGEEETLDRNAAFITGNVFGGGKFGHVGDFTFDDDDSNDIPDGKPVSCAEGTGTCTVTVSNGSIGPDNMQMTSVGGPDDNGHVFGGGRGTSDLYYDDTTNKTDVEKQTAIAALSDEDLAARITAVDNLAYVNKTEVTINGSAFVKGSVYGGGFDGHVLGDTHVTIDGDCQIGNGDGVNRPYTSAEWEDSQLIPQTGDPASVTTLAASHTNSLPECASWPFTSPYAPHDKFALFESGGKMYYDESHTKDAKGGSYSASDGHTFYGNVFAGGSGYYPYAPGKWLHKSGWVEGNTLLEIKGGHILTNVYGGNEMTNVGDGLSADKGKCTIRMTGGTLGVPRTLAQIDAHPVTCYLFGAGKGDQIVTFNTETNVKEVDVEITGGRIYGSVFGGGEDGHVLGNVKMTIGNNDGTGPAIGTWGTSYVDGNVFGGGRGFSGNALTAGNVGGSIDLDIKGGTMLGSIYGGGRLGSVGYGLYAPEDDNYGKMRANANNDAGDEAAYYATKGRGHININISGGTIGNDREFILPMESNIPSGLDDDFKNWNPDDWTAWKAHNKVPKTEFNTSNGRVTHTKGGNVFAGGMGRRTDLAGGEISNWTQLGNAKSTTLTITGGTIKSNVYGGGEFGAVTSGETSEGGTTTITIDNVTIGTEVKNSEDVVEYTFGSVFGGGYGTEDDLERTPPVASHSQVDRLGALVAGNTSVSMSSGYVRASVYGGGEVAAVGGDTYVTISGGEIGRNEVRAKEDSNSGYVMFGGATMGNVYGGGKGTSTHPLIGVVKGNTNVTINAGANGEPFIYHNVYGGGALGSVGTFLFSDGLGENPPAGYEYMASVMKTVPKGIPLIWTAGGKATVNIKGGTIGISGRDNGMVFGSSRGDIAKQDNVLMGRDKEGNYVYVQKDPYDKMAWVLESEVNIGADGTTGPHVKGSVYGGGENGHVFTHAAVNVKSGTIGIVDPLDTWYSFIPEGMAETNPLYATYEDIEKKAWITRGNIYGGGCGTDTYKDNNGKEHHNVWAGCVIGNADVNISGGHIAQSVYGGGSLGSVGRVMEGDKIEYHPGTEPGFALSWPVKFEYQPLSNGVLPGKTTVNITGGRIGTTGSDNGDVFGGSRGEAGDRYEDAQLADVRTTEVNINYPSTPTGDDILAFVENYDRDDKEYKYSLRIKDKDSSDKLVDAICGSVYGGSENGHVNEDTKVTLTKGLIGHAIYGGGKGKGTYKKLKAGAVPNSDDPDDYDELNDISAGKVYGNTQVIMEGGHVLRNIYGGGNLGSVGKGNYAVGTDDYYYDDTNPNFIGYGEKLVGNLWDNVSNNSKAFLNSGKTSVNIKGGVVGFMAKSSTPVIPKEGDDGTTFGTVSASGDDDMKALKKKLVKVMSKDGLPTGNIFGGCRGQAAAEVLDTLNNLPVFLGYVNETDVTIGQEAKNAVGTVGDEGYEPAVPASSPRIYGSVYGGGQDGHVRRSTNVTVKKGEIGIKYNAVNVDVFGDLQVEGKDNLHWLHRGNVYGGGSGIGTYEDSTGEHPSSSAGSVTHCTTVTVGNGITGLSGTTEDAPGNVIYRNVYGGGSLASVIPPSYAMGGDAPNPDDTGGIGRKSVNTVTISGAVGVLNGYNEKYGGEVYGAGRGEKGLDPTYFALSVWTKVRIMNGATIMNNVFGGGDAGKVKKDTDVIVGYTGSE